MLVGSLGAMTQACVVHDAAVMPFGDTGSTSTDGVPSPTSAASESGTTTGTAGGTRCEGRVMVDGDAFERSDGSPFQVRGNGYRDATLLLPQTYGLNTTATTLREMATWGYNTVALTLDDGTHEDSAAELDGATARITEVYAQHLVEVIDTAATEGLRVVLRLPRTVPPAYRTQQWPEREQEQRWFGPGNLELLSRQRVSDRAAYVRDVLQAIADAGLDDALFAVELDPTLALTRQEPVLDATGEPVLQGGAPLFRGVRPFSGIDDTPPEFTATTPYPYGATTITAFGQSFQVEDAEQRAALSTLAQEQTLCTLGAAAKEVDPCLLVTAAVDTPAVAAALRGSEPTAPFAAGFSDNPCLDYISMRLPVDATHVFEDEVGDPLTLGLDDRIQALDRSLFEFGWPLAGAAKPLVLAHISVGPHSADATGYERAAYVNDAIARGCTYSVAGASLERWNDHLAPTPVQTALDDDGVIRHVLSPALRQDLCAPLPAGHIEASVAHIESHGGDPCVTLASFRAWVHPPDPEVILRRFLSAQPIDPDITADAVRSNHQLDVLVDFRGSSATSLVARALVEVPGLYPREPWQNRRSTVLRPSACPLP